MNRRKFIRTGLSGLATMAAGGLLLGNAIDGRKTSVAAEGVAFAESERTGDVREFNLKAQIAEIDIGAKNTFKAWTYNQKSPGPEIRVKEGEILRVVLENNLPEPTTIHWHGLPVPNAMDGVPDMTQKPIQPGETFVYEFVAQPSGSYLYHSHVGYQLDQGLYGAIIVEPRQESLAYDKEYTLILRGFLNRNNNLKAYTFEGSINSDVVIACILARNIKLILSRYLRFRFRRHSGGNRATSGRRN